MTSRTPIETSALVPFVSAETPSNPVAENPGQWLAREAADLGVPVSVIAREAGVNRTTIYRWKRGDNEPYLRTVERVRLVVAGYWDRIGGRHTA